MDTKPNQTDLVKVRGQVVMFILAENAASTSIMEESAKLCLTAQLEPSGGGANWIGDVMHSIKNPIL